MKKWNPSDILNDISGSEIEIMCNGEHYHTMSETRKKVLELSLGIENGFFAEVGACMGTDTKFLEACGWNGILVEPDKNLYEFLLKTRSANSIIERCALVSNSYYEKSNTIDNRNIHAFSLPDYVVGINREEGGYKTYDALPFSFLLKKHNIKKIDIFILDVEGMEMDIMDGIDFEEVDIKNFIIECNTDRYTLDTLDTYMSLRGYSNEGMVCISGTSQFDYHYKKK